jgi:hypothetical protein
MVGVLIASAFFFLRPLHHCGEKESKRRLHFDVAMPADPRAEARG